EYGFQGTVFVNPDFISEGEPRTLADHPTAWGNLNRAEIVALDSGGVLEIQSHTMTHNFIFASPRLIDFYTPAKFNQYYWLAWLLFPEHKPDWSDHIEELREAIPTGYPIFEFDRAVARPQFIPDPAFIARAVACYAVRGEDCLTNLNQLPEAEKGAQENDQAWRERVTWELSESRLQLETIVQHPIDFVCFPGGGYDQTSVDIAEQVGYRAY